MGLTRDEPRMGQGAEDGARGRAGGADTGQKAQRDGQGPESPRRRQGNKQLNRWSRESSDEPQSKTGGKVRQTSPEA